MNNPEPEPHRRWITALNLKGSLPFIDWNCRIKYSTTQEVRE